MPTPLELLLDPVSLGIIALYALLMLWEALFPARKLPAIPYWKTRGIIFFFVYFYLSSYLPLMYASWLPSVQLLDLSGMNTALAAVLGVLLFEVGLFLWHRSMHKSNALWRIFHQMHHSAERLDTFGAYYFSPMDMIGFTLLGTLCFSVVMGMSPQAVTIVLLVTNFLSIFQHANIRTPSWLCYVIQRPESHAVHHAKGIHGFNYADLPLIDMIFGTFRNPEEYVEETGFYNGASSRIAEMLTFQDVSVPENTTTNKSAEHEKAIV